MGSEFQILGVLDDLFNLRWKKGDSVKQVTDCDPCNYYLKKTNYIKY